MRPAVRLVACIVRGSAACAMLQISARWAVPVMSTLSSRRRRMFLGAAAVAAAGATGPARATDWAFWRGTHKGSGKVLKEQRPLEPVQSLHLGGSTRLALRQADRDFIEIETDDNLLGLIEAPVKSGILRIDTEGSMRPTRLEITLHLRELTSIEAGGSAAVLGERWTGRRLKLSLGGSAVVKMAQLDVQELNLSAGGSSVFNLGGRCARLDAALGGSSVLSAKHLRCVEANLRAGGSSQAVAWVTERLDAKASGSAGVRYYGAPKVDAQRSGSAVVTGLGSEPGA
jgi:hypothetical protein